jgi:predicted nuclease of predicted toxin-antitoxin system
VAESACKFLEGRGHSVIRLRDVIPVDSPDPMVAKVAQDNDAILLTHDGDFKRIAPRIAHGQRARFNRLSKVHLNCEQARATDRLAAAIGLIEFEWVGAQTRTATRLHISVGLNIIRTHR